MGAQRGLSQCLLVQWRPHPTHHFTTATVLPPKTPNHPHPIGTCYVGIQVSRGSHTKLLRERLVKRRRGWTGGVSFLFCFSSLLLSLSLLALKTMPLKTISPLCDNKRNIIKALNDLFKTNRRLHLKNCHKIQSDRFTLVIRWRHSGLWHCSMNHMPPHTQTLSSYKTIKLFICKISLKF